MLDNLRQVTQFAREHESDFLELVFETNEKVLMASQKEDEQALAKAESRIRAVDILIQKLYEDNVAGKISDDRFVKMTEAYEQEQGRLSEKVNELRELMVERRSKTLNVEYFLNLVKKYTDIKELNSEIIREFIQKIIVHQAEKKDGHRIQRITIVYNFIGEIPPLKTKSKTA